MSVSVVSQGAASTANSMVALSMTIHAAESLKQVIQTNLGPRGTLKMLVSGSGDIKLTKDGNVLLSQMQIQHPTASLIAHTATSQDNVLGDGTTSIVLLIGELLHQSMRHIQEGIQPRSLVDGFELARIKALEVIDSIATTMEDVDHGFVLDVVRTAVRTKLRREMADKVAEIATDAVNTIRKPDMPVDLHMVEIMAMQHDFDMGTELIKGIVLDHGSRHAGMPKKLKNAYILTLNVSLEYDKTEVNAGFFYSSAEEKKKLAESERKITDERVQKVIDLKKLVCDGTDYSFVVVNQNGIDPMSLDMLAREGILAMRRAKRRNMERLMKSCGGLQANSVDTLSKEHLGFAESIQEVSLGEDKFTFIEGVKNPESVTILIRAPVKHQVEQLKDAVRDGLRAAKIAMEKKKFVPGAGALEVKVAYELEEFARNVTGKKRIGVQAFTEAVLVIPKVLAANSGFDIQESIIALQDEIRKGKLVGIDLDSGRPFDPTEKGIWDNHIVKRQIVNSGTLIAMQLLLVDEIMMPGKNQAGQADQGPGGMPAQMPMPT